jgi:aminoglycoside phosphotransferase family enzyme
MKPPGIDDKVAFLQKPEAYPGRVRRVETQQTHMSWIFLTDEDAWKLKKPVRTEYFDFTNAGARRRNCDEEVRLNRRLAANVYRGVVPLTVDRNGAMQLSGDGKAVDWLVWMRRLPRERMLDELITRRSFTGTDISRVASLLASFYRNAPPVRVPPSQYRKRLASHLESARIELTKPEYGLPSETLERLVKEQVASLHEHFRLFDERVEAGRIVEAHGDLRPEHICLESQPVIIDCLEFNRNLRLLDAASELIFLALECERLGAPEIGTAIFSKYCEETGDRPGSIVLAFYRAYHACVRATLSIRHLADGGVQDRAAWIARTNRYLSLAGAAKTIT